jgi:hypothetical protein
MYAPALDCAARMFFEESAFVRALSKQDDRAKSLIDSVSDSIGDFSVLVNRGI